MAANQKPAILTDPELQALTFGENMYAALAKQHAGDLVETLEVPAESREVVIGRLALKLESLDLEQRIEVARHIQALALLLSGEGNIVFLPPAVVTEEGVSTDMSASLPVSNGNVAGLIASKEATDAGLADDGEETTNIQFKWLANIFSDAQMMEIKSFNPAQLHALSVGIGQHYLGLKITRATAENKAKRIQQMSLLLEGNNYRQVDDLTVTGKNRSWLALRQMATSISSRTTSAELGQIIEQAKLTAESEGANEFTPLEQELDPHDKAEIEQKKVVPLTEDQKVWFSRVLRNDSLLEMVAGMNNNQRQELAQKLASRLSSGILPIVGMEEASVRERQVIAMVSGQDMKKLSKEISRSTGLIEKDLKHSAKKLGPGHVPPADLEKIVREIAVSVIE